jgi:hypothetical protein
LPGITMRASTPMIAPKMMVPMISNTNTPWRIHGLLQIQRAAFKKRYCGSSLGRGNKRV